MVGRHETATISDSETMILALQDEIRRSDASRYDHRLHGVLLVAQGMSCPRVAELLGDSARSVVNWVQRFEADGFGALQEAQRPGRPSRLSQKHLQKVQKALRASPREAGMDTGIWDGPTLSAWLRKEHGVELKARQCQRLFGRLGFRLRKPRPMVAKADPDLQAAHKKTPAPGKAKRR